jgi:serine/threonine protein kinase
VAIKQLVSTEQKAFESERDFLAKLTMQRHPNTMPLLATYRFQGKYHLVFPWAPKNLREYWKSIPTQEKWDQAGCRIFLQQVQHLVSALEAIHVFRLHDMSRPDPKSFEIDFGRLTTTRALRIPQPKMDSSLDLYGRHGDLKPENVLWLENGTLQVADFGLGKFHRLESRSGVDPQSVGGSQTYSPPELVVGEKVSRAYDIWSLGCIFLEFITWLSGGNEKLELFTESRDERALDGASDDIFYSVHADAHANKTASIRKAVGQQIQDLRTAYPQSRMVDDFLNIIEREMLVIDPQKRITAKDLKVRMATMLEAANHPSYFGTHQYPWN